MDVQSALKDDPNVDAHGIAKLIILDTAIAANVLRAANTASFAGQKKLKTLPHAIARIGLGRIRSIVFTAAVEQMFLTNNSVVANILLEAWEHSLKVATHSLAFLNLLEDKNMSRHIDPEVLTLIAITHRIGLLPVYVELSDTDFDANDKEFLAKCEGPITQDLTKKILSSWNMDAEIVKGASSWHEKSNIDNPLSYADIIKLINISLGKSPLDKKSTTIVLHNAVKNGIIPSLSFFKGDIFTCEVKKVRSRIA
jgi:HD-like signal output (HDOD) protein